MAIYNNDVDPNEKMWEKQNENVSRVEKHKELLQQVQEVTIQLLDIQEQKFNALVNFLEYEEALTKDPETAKRITQILKEAKVWN